MARPGLQCDVSCRGRVCAGGRWPRALRFGDETGDRNRDAGESQPAPGSSFPTETTLDLVLAHGPGLRTEVGKGEEEEDNFLPASWAGAPPGEVCRGTSPAAAAVFPVSVSLLRVRSPGSTCSWFSHVSGGAAVWLSSSHQARAEPCLPPWPRLRPVPSDPADS